MSYFLCTIITQESRRLFFCYWPYDFLLSASMYILQQRVCDLLFISNEKDFLWAFFSVFCFAGLNSGTLLKVRHVEQKTRFLLENRPRIVLIQRDIVRCNKESHFQFPLMVFDIHFILMENTIFHFNFLPK